MSADTICYLGPEQGAEFLSRVLTDSREAQLIYEAMIAEGLEAQPERTQLFSLFSRDSLQSIAISVTPLTTGDLSREGGLSVSQGGHAQGVVVDVEGGTELVSFTHFAVSGEEVVQSRHDLSDIRRDDKSPEATDEFVRALAERVGKVKTARPLVEIEARQVRSLAAVSYNNLLSDDFSRSVHGGDEIISLRRNTNIVAEIGLFVLFRTQGSACCSCSCSCWGSSSCSCSYVG